MAWILFQDIAVDVGCKQFKSHNNAWVPDILHILLLDDLAINCLGLLVKLFDQLFQTILDSLRRMLQVMNDLVNEDLIVPHIF